MVCAFTGCATARSYSALIYVVSLRMPRKSRSESPRAAGGKKMPVDALCQMAPRVSMLQGPAPWARWRWSLKFVSDVMLMLYVLNFAYVVLRVQLPGGTYTDLWQCTTSRTRHELGSVGSHTVDVVCGYVLCNPISKRQQKLGMPLWLVFFCSQLPLCSAVRANTTGALQYIPMLIFGARSILRSSPVLPLLFNLPKQFCLNGTFFVPGIALRANVILIAVELVLCIASLGEL